MACSYLCNRNVCIRYLFEVFASDFMIAPNIFDGRDGFARRHGIRPSPHFLVPSWELTRKSAPIPNLNFGNSTCTGEVTKLTIIPTLIKHTEYMIFYKIVSFGVVFSAIEGM